MQHKDLNKGNQLAQDVFGLQNLQINAQPYLQHQKTQEVELGNSAATTETVLTKHIQRQENIYEAVLTEHIG